MYFMIHVVKRNYHNNFHVDGFELKKYLLQTGMLISFPKTSYIQDIQ